MPHGSSFAFRPILIVDDVASEALTLDLLFRSLGVETLRVANTAEAGAILERLRPAAIITDLVMPGADGFDWLFLIAEHAPTVPVMVVTSSERLPLKAAGELGHSYGLTDLVCIPKPVNLTALTAFIARIGVSFRSPTQSLH